MDRRLAEPRESGERSQAHVAPLDRLERERNPQRREDARPREVGQREDRVERGQLWHAPVERVSGIAEDDRVAERLDHVPHTQAERQEEEGEQPGAAVLDEVRDAQPGGGHERDGGGHPRQVEDDDQGQAGDRSDVAQQQPEHEQVCGGALLGRVAVLPRPRAFEALTHLGEVGVGVVAQVEEAQEHLAMRLSQVAVHVRRGGHERQEEPGRDGKRPFAEALSHRARGRGHRAAYRRHRPRLKRSTVKSARRTSFSETLEAPATRSSNLMGTSTTL